MRVTAGLVDGEPVQRREGVAVVSMDSALS